MNAVDMYVSCFECNLALSPPWVAHPGCTALPGRTLRHIPGAAKSLQSLVCRRILDFGEEL